MFLWQIPFCANKNVRSLPLKENFDHNLWYENENMKIRRWKFCDQPWHLFCQLRPNVFGVRLVAQVQNNPFLIWCLSCVPIPSPWRHSTEKLMTLLNKLKAFFCSLNGRIKLITGDNVQYNYLVKDSWIGWTSLLIGLLSYCADPHATLLLQIKHPPKPEIKTNIQQSTAVSQRLLGFMNSFHKF